MQSESWDELKPEELWILAKFIAETRVLCTYFRIDLPLQLIVKSFPRNIFFLPIGNYITMESGSFCMNAQGGLQAGLASFPSMEMVKFCD